MTSHPFTLRFAVVHEGQPVSAIWRVWTSHNGDNLMLSPSRVANITKVTFHNKPDNGYSHLAVTRQHRTQMIQQGVDMPKLSDELSWHRPLVSADTPRVWAAQILMPRSYLHPAGYKTTKPLVSLPVAATNKSTAVNLYFTKIPPVGWTFSESLKLIGHTQLSNDDYAVLIAGEIDFDAEDFTARHAPLINSRTPRFLTKRNQPNPDEPHRMLLWNDPRTDDGGALRLIDVGGIKIIPKQTEPVLDHQVSQVS